MQSLPSHQQSLASGIFATLIRLCTTIILGISTAVFASVAATPAGRADQSLSYTRAFQVSVGFAAFSLLCVPFVKLKTQGNIPVESGSVAESETAEAKS